MLSRTVLSILLTLFMMVAYVSCSTPTPMEEQTVNNAGGEKREPVGPTDEQLKELGYGIGLPKEPPKISQDEAIRIANTRYLWPAPPTVGIATRYMLLTVPGRFTDLPVWMVTFDGIEGLGPAGAAGPWEYKRTGGKSTVFVDATSGEVVSGFEWGKVEFVE